MQHKNKEIASSTTALPVLGAFAGELDKAGTFDAGKEFLKGIFKRDQEANDGEETKSAIEKTENFLNKINQSGVNVSTSGVGIEKKFGNEEQGFNAKVFGNQPFGGQFDYGGQLGFNMKF
tara:strand:+ start:496 stop:855 length:360 start_codon:yes stop_codon:yes gene_type:complete